MECRRCNSQNDPQRKYCHECGTPIGFLCDRCGAYNSHNDKYCGSCGLPLSLSATKENPFTMRQSEIPRQYSPAEIEELLALRKELDEERKSNETFSQDDLDNLFG